MKVFGSLAALSTHIDKAVSLMEKVEHHALEKCAQIVEKRAKNKFGEYQDAAGPFAAWAELAESTKADRVNKGYTENDPLLRSGKTRDSIEHKVNGSNAYVGSDSDILVYQEIGTSKITPRSTLGGAAAESVPEICQIMGKAAMMSLDGQNVSDAILIHEE